MGTWRTHSYSPVGGGTMLIGMLLFISLVGIIVTLVGFLIQLAKKKPSKKSWGITMACFLMLFSISFIFLPNDSEVTTEVKEKTEAEKFAKDNDISVELAESIEQALSQSEHSYTLSQVYNWEQIDDYAYGQRYTGWMNMEYVWVFYVKDDRLDSIRQQKGLSVIYQAE